MDKLRIESHHITSPVTALEFFGHHLIAGEGPNINVYDINSGKIQQRCGILRDANIHGIRLCAWTNLACIFGSKQLAIVELSVDYPYVTVRNEVIELSDHIWEVSWLHPKYATLTTSLSDLGFVTHEESLACVLAHNSVVHFEPSTRNVLCEVHCVEKCILYCASCQGDRWENLLVASGTVFNQVVLWRPASAPPGARAPVLHVLHGHEGVIFSIAFDVRKRLICSVSDDRSIRLWVPPSQESGPDNVTEYTLKNTFYGHAARVWDVKLLQDCIISIGEDATCFAWSYDGNIIHTFKGHKGTSIWSLAVHANEKIVATGGGDTSLRLWRLRDHSVTPTNTSILRPASQASDIPRTVGILDSNTVVVMMNEGKLLSFNKTNGEWSTLLDDEKYKSYTVISCHTAKQMLAIGNIFGQLTLLHKNERLSQDIYNGKVFSVVWCGETEHGHLSLLTTGPEGQLDLWNIILSDAHGKISTTKIFTGTLPYAKQRWVTTAIVLSTYDLLVCGDRAGSVHVYSLKSQNKDPVQSLWKIHGKSGVTDVCYHNNQVYTVGRDGHYRVYNVIESGLAMLSANRALKGFEWLAKLLIVNQDILILGFYTDKFIAYNTSSGEQVLQVHCGGGHRAWDFRLGADDKYSFVYIKQADVVSCDGQISSCQTILKPSLHGKEVNDVKHLFSEVNTDFLVTAGEDTNICLVAVPSDSKQMRTHQVVAELKGHLSSVRALSISGKENLSPDSSNDTQNSVEKASQTCVLFSAGGRCEIKAWNIHRSKLNTQEISQIEGDTLKTSLNEEHNHAKKKVTEKISCKIWHEYLTTHALTGTKKLKYKPWKCKDWNPDPETRYMDLTSFPMRVCIPEAPDYLHCVVAACSDAFVRIFSFNAQTRKFQVICQSDFHDHCVLKVEHLLMESFEVDSENDKSGSDNTALKHKPVFVLSAGTDGRVAFWDITNFIRACVDYEVMGLTETGGMLDELKKSLDLGEIIPIPGPDLAFKVHQSGINALHVVGVSDTDGKDILVGTGGDDNAVKLTRLSRDTGAWHVTTQGQIEAAHATQVTGLRFLDAEILMTTSIDQRLNIWKFDTASLQSELQMSKYMNIADIANIDAWKNKEKAGNVHLAVCGVGLQLLKIKL